MINTDDRIDTSEASSSTESPSPPLEAEAAALQQMQEKIVGDLATVKLLQAELARLSKHVVSLTHEIEELSAETDDDGPNLEPDPELEGYRDQLRQLSASCCEHINVKKNRILQLLTVAEAETSTLVQARAELILKKEKIAAAEEAEKIEKKSEKAEEATINETKVTSTSSSPIVYSKETLMALSKLTSPPPPITAEVREKFPELFRTNLKQQQQQQQAQCHRRRQSLRDALIAANFC